jgi:hypothetical protein
MKGPISRLYLKLEGRRKAISVLRPLLAICALHRIKSSVEESEEAPSLEGYVTQRLAQRRWR